MRNQWMRLLLLRHRTPSQPHIFQVHHLPSFTPSIPRPRAPHAPLNPFPLRHHFTSSPELAAEPSDQSTVLLSEIFAKSGKSSEEIKLDLDHKNVVITHDLIVSVLEDQNIDPDVAKRVFDWVSENRNEELSSRSYNLMLRVLGGNGPVKETWDLIGVMKEKGVGVTRGNFVKIAEKFANDGLSDDVEKLKGLYASGSKSREKKFPPKARNSCKKYDRSAIGAFNEVCYNVSAMVKKEVWGDDVERKLQEMDLEFSSDLVTNVLKNLESEPNKALIFFRWVQESGLFKHDQRSFNAMAMVLGKHDHNEQFWRVVNEMRSEGHEMERETYINNMNRFIKNKMINDAVDLYEFAMLGGIKPSPQDCIFLLKKIVVSEELDMELFEKVLDIFKASGNVLTDANLDSVIKSLTSVGRMDECNTILAAMEAAGYVPSKASLSKIAFKLSSGGKTEEVQAFMDEKQNSNDTLYESLVSGYCLAHNLDEASNSLREMVEKEVPKAAHALKVLVDTYCRKNRPMDAYKLVLEMVNEKGLSPSHKTYKDLTNNLLVRERFDEALVVMTMMKEEGLPPYLDSFVRYLSRTGSADDAVKFSEAMTTKRFPSTSVFIELFEGYLKAGRQNEAQEFLSKCPGYIRNHADILNLFCESKSGATRSDAVSV